MTDKKILKGITWDHPRGYQPLRAIGDLWNGQQEAEVRWDVRSLREFGDTPIEQLIGNYDLIVLDHPYVGSAAANQLLAPLEGLVPEEFMALQRKETIGPGFESYWYAGHCWALPVDAAAQVAAYRKDLTDAIGWDLPDQVTGLATAASLLPAGKWIGVPLCPTDIWCVFLSLCALYSDGKFFTVEGVDRIAGEWALDQIGGWKRFLHRDSLRLNPILMLEHMASRDEIIYVPFTFGYTNYSRKGWRDKLVCFCDGPRFGQGRHCSLLGGAGVAVSARTEHLSECLEFIQFALSPEVQKGIYFREQGQPAHLSAWLEPANNEACSGFFSGTLDTMRNVYVRPRPANFNRFQEMAADHVHESVSGNGAAGAAVIKLNSMYQKLVNATV